MDSVHEIKYLRKDSNLSNLKASQNNISNENKTIIKNNVEKKTKNHNSLSGNK